MSAERIAELESALQTVLGGPEPLNRHQKGLIRREAFMHGFVAARDPKNPRDTLLVLEEAERAYALHADRVAKDPESP